MFIRDIYVFRKICFHYTIVMPFLGIEGNPPYRFMLFRSLQLSIVPSQVSNTPVLILASGSHSDAAYLPAIAQWHSLAKVRPGIWTCFIVNLGLQVNVTAVSSDPAVSTYSFSFMTAFLSGTVPICLAESGRCMWKPGPGLISEAALTLWGRPVPLFTSRRWAADP